MTLAEELDQENEALRRRFVHHTRPKGPLTMEQARALCGWSEAMKKPVKKEKPKMTKDVEPKHVQPVAEGDDISEHINPTRGPDLSSTVQTQQRLKAVVEALEVAGLAEKTADENLVSIIAGVPADGPSGTLSVVTARRVIHAIEDAGYKITK